MVYISYYFMHSTSPDNNFSVGFGLKLDMNVDGYNTIDRNLEKKTKWQPNKSSFSLFANIGSIEIFHSISSEEQSIWKVWGRKTVNIV